MITVQSFWIGKELDIFGILTIKSYLLKGYKFDLYVYDDVKNIPTGTNILDAHIILDKNNIFVYECGGISAFSNMFRYILLYEKGGIWVDMDMICVNNLDTLLQYDYVFSSETNMCGFKHINVGFIKVPKKSKLMYLCYENCKLLRDSTETLKWGSLGPKLFNRIVKSLKLTKHTMPSKIFCPIYYNNLDQLTILNTVDNDILCVHLWNRCWDREKKNKKLILNSKLFREIYISEV